MTPPVQRNYRKVAPFSRPRVDRRTCCHSGGDYTSRGQLSGGTVWLTDQFALTRRKRVVPFGAMIRRYQRAIASFTTLLFVVAVLSCACGALAGTRVATVASADDHACCKTSEDRPATPAPTHDSCAHCGHLSIAPAHEIDHAPPLTLVSLSNFCDACARFAPRFSPASWAPTSSVSPPDLLSLYCALRL
jgi:hypothetical protein